MSSLLISDDGPVRTLTLNRPERRNALTPELMDELIVALRSVDPVRTRVLLLTGAGEAFCSGLDLAALTAMAGFSQEQHRVEAERVATMFRSLFELDLPTIALVQGPAVAGGTGLATLCDFTLAASDARFGYTEVRIGFVPALVSAYLALQVGDKVARSLLLTGRLFPAEEALRLGLVGEVMEASALQPRAAELAETLIRNSPESLRATKRLLRAQQAPALDAALALAMDANAASRQTDDFREGVSSFIEKRKPVWR